MTLYLQTYTPLTIEKQTMWEAKIKTMKGLREMQSTQLEALREKMGSALMNQLTFLTETIDKASNILTKCGTPHCPVKCVEQVIFFIYQTYLYRIKTIRE